MMSKTESDLSVGVLVFVLKVSIRKYLADPLGDRFVIDPTRAFFRDFERGAIGLLNWFICVLDFNCVIY